MAVEGVDNQNPPNTQQTDAEKADFFMTVIFNAVLMPDMMQSVQDTMRDEEG